jgi:hypothetical protein
MFPIDYITHCDEYMLLNVWKKQIIKIYLGIGIISWIFLVYMLAFTIKSMKLTSSYNALLVNCEKQSLTFPAI